MKKPLAIIASTAALAAFSHGLMADSVVSVYQCELKEGKTQEELQSLNGQWLKWVKENVSDEIESSVGTAIVGDLDVFIFADTYPDLNTWAAAQTALDGESASHLENLFDETSECTESRLWKFEPTE